MHIAIPEDRFWYDFSYTCIGIGIVFAVLAAVAGAIDYVGVKMSGPAFRVATAHALFNVAVVLCYLASFFLRRNGAAIADPRWPVALFFALLGLGMLGVSGWLGGKLAFEHRIGVEEGLRTADPGTRRERAAS
jgi:uncharacterized membrane protein